MTLERDIATTLGASEIAAVVGADPYKTADELLEQKVTGAQIEPNEHMIRGTCLENGLLDWWERIDGRELPIRQRLFVHPGHRWACATIDGITVNGAQYEHLVEVKCPGGSWRQWDERNGTCPFHYKVQVIWQLGIARAESGDLITGELAAGPSPFKGHLMRFQIQYDEELFERLLIAGEQFMQRVNDERARRQNER